MPRGIKRKQAETLEETLEDNTRFLQPDQDIWVIGDSLPHWARVLQTRKSDRRTPDGKQICWWGMHESVRKRKRYYEEGYLEMEKSHAQAELDLLLQRQQQEKQLHEIRVKLITEAADQERQLFTLKKTVVQLQY
ncbi:hypothetical protein DPMN_121613 [Dreissena polymorpha]|uniref:Uncharacterized protein n=1 Tax=Dreissena polymorpha TaxID=45954 RepID=A0A9D4GLY3_DREPO|nr:hypothetical protein DPMN_121613 [Dreissena polymorpha]